MDDFRALTRRQSIKWILRISGVLTAGAWLPRVRAAPGPGSVEKALLVEGVGETEGYSVRELTRRVFAEAGGMGRFVSRGDVVVVKPNLSWARPPHLAATTDPDVLEAVIELCQEAGAGKVRIADHTIHDARQCFSLTGAAMAARKTGAELVFPRSSLMREMKIQGTRLDVWPVFVPVVEADKIINLPIAKHHSLSGLTLGMKNWIGAVGGSRWSLHQDIHQSVVDLARFFKPAVTLIDAIRTLVRNGPSGGSPGDVVNRNTLILSADPVAADAAAARLFQRDPRSLQFIELARRAGLGSDDAAQLDHRRVAL